MADLEAVTTFVARSVRATGKTGASTTPIEVAGGCPAGGPPSSGTHAVGEIVLDADASGWYCTVAGTPGSWVRMNQKVAAASTDSRLASSEIRQRSFMLGQTRGASEAMRAAGTSPFLDYCRSIATNLEVLHRYDLPPTTAAAASQPSIVKDRRQGGASRTGSAQWAFWGMDSALDRGSSYGMYIGLASGKITVDNWAGDTGGLFTFVISVRFSRFHQNHNLVTGAGTGYEVVAIDAGSGYTIRLKKVGGGTVCDSTINITDIWQEHLIIVSMGGSTASSRIVIDGTDRTGSITSQTNGTATSRLIGSSGVTTEHIIVSAFAEWSRQLTTTEEAGVYAACQYDYRRRPILHGVHSDLQFSTADTHPANVKAVAQHLSPHIARLSLRWHYMQASSGAAIDWSKLDSAVDLFTAAGIEVVITILGTPTWKNGGTDESSIPDTAGFASWLTDLAAFVTTAVNRYKDRVKRWLIWNEPNFGDPTTGFWRPMAPNSTSTTSFTVGSTTTLTLNNAASFAASGSGAIQASGQVRTDISWTGKTGNQLTGVTSSGSGVHGIGAVVQQYNSTQWGSDWASLCNSVRSAIVAEDPQAWVCTGGVLGFGYGGAGVSGVTLLNAGNATLSSAFTHFGMHPYPSAGLTATAVTDFSNHFGDLAQFRDQLVANGRYNSDVFADEFGWYTSTDVGANLATTKQSLSDAIDMMENYFSSWLEGYCYFMSHDIVASGFYGLLDSSLAPRSTGDQFQARATAPPGVPPISYPAVVPDTRTLVPSASGTTDRLGLPMPDGSTRVIASSSFLDAEEWPERALRPVNVLAESFDSWNTGTANQTVLTTGQLFLVAIPLRAGMKASLVEFCSGTQAAVTPTNWWFALYDVNLNLLRQTADQTTTAWAASTSKTLSLSSAYTVPNGSSGRFYLGIMVKATTVPSLLGAGGNATIYGLSSLNGNSSSTGLTTTAPNPAGAMSAGAVRPYCFVA